MCVFVIDLKVQVPFLSQLASIYLAVEEIPDELSQVSVVGLLLKPQRAHIVLVGCKLRCKKRKL